MNTPETPRAPQALEVQIASELSTMLHSVPDGSVFVVHPSDDFCYSLELFMPMMLAKRFPEWEKESLDGIFVAEARKIRDSAAQFAGTCILISDQTVTPFFVEIALSPSGDSIRSFRVRLGEPGKGRLGISGPACNSVDAQQLLATVTRRLNDIDWSYTVDECSQP